MTTSLKILSSKADSNTWESFTRSGLKLESVHQESPHSDVLLGKGYQATSETETMSEASYLGLRRKITGLLLSGPKSSFQIKVHFEFHLEIKVWSLEEDWRGTESKLLEVQCEVSEVSDDLGAVTSAGVGPLCFIKSKVNAAAYQEIWSTLCFHLLTSFMEMLISFSSRTLAPAHSAKTTSKWFAAHDITVLDWPANMPDLNPIWNLWDISRER